MNRWWWRLSRTNDEAYSEIAALLARVERLKCQQRQERAEFLEALDLTKRMHEAEVSFLRDELARAYEGDEK